MPKFFHKVLPPDLSTQMLLGKHLRHKVVQCRAATANEALALNPQMHTY